MGFSAPSPSAEARRTLLYRKPRIRHTRTTLRRPTAARVANFGQATCTGAMFRRWRVSDAKHTYAPRFTACHICISPLARRCASTAQSQYEQVAKRSEEQIARRSLVLGLGRLALPAHRERHAARVLLGLLLDLVHRLAHLMVKCARWCWRGWWRQRWGRPGGEGDS